MCLLNSLVEIPFNVIRRILNVIRLSGRAYLGLIGWFLLFRIFSVAISVNPHVCFILVLILIFMFLR